MFLQSFYKISLVVFFFDLNETWLHRRFLLQLGHNFCFRSWIIMANNKNVDAGQFRFETNYYGFLYGKKSHIFSKSDNRSILRFHFYFHRCRLFGVFQQWFLGWSDEDISKQTAVLLVFQGYHRDVKMIRYSQMLYWEDHSLTVHCNHQEGVRVWNGALLSRHFWSGLWKVCDAANNSNCGLLEYYDRRKNCIQIFVKDESSSQGF